MMLRIRAVHPLHDHWLRLTLTDGSVVDRDVTDLLVGPVFEPVRSRSTRFAEVTAVDGTVTWPGELDLDPDVLIWGGPPRDAPGAVPERSLRPVPVRA